MCEGYRNVIVEDPSLEGAAVVLFATDTLHGVKERWLGVTSSVLRFGYCLSLDDRSVLARSQNKQIILVTLGKSFWLNSEDNNGSSPLWLEQSLCGGYS